MPDGNNSFGDGNGIRCCEREGLERLPRRANDVKFYALGMGTGVTTSALDPIAYDGAADPTGTNISLDLVTDFSQLT